MLPIPFSHAARSSNYAMMIVNGFKLHVDLTTLLTNLRIMSAHYGEYMLVDTP